MALNVGDRLGHYDVTALIGQGGMGEVYRAKDTKLGRDVALKVLPDLFADDPERLARFQREARVLASLNHPNIASIYGLEESGDTRALVLELVEGPTLAERIARGAISVDEALPIARQIAEALEAVHERGVIHRDLKPANVKVKADGMVKVLDFGLAKALDPSPEGNPSESPTLTAAATQMGVIMGTAAYMSPEQARGKTVDKRADIWAFGVVLFEMLTGRRAFEGEDVSLTLSAVLQREPVWNELPSDVPATLRTYLRRCLAKDPRQRVHDIADVRLALEGAFETTVGVSAADSAVSQPAGWRQALPWVAGLVLAVITGFAVWGLMRPAAQPVSRFPVLAPTGVQPTGRLALAPEGRTIAFGGTQGGDQSGGQFQTYVRSLDQLEAVPLSGTEGTVPGDFSADGQWLLVIDLQVWPRMLKRVPTTGGPAVPVGETPGRGATWGRDDTIIYLGSNEGLWSIPASGGERTQLTTLTEGEIGHYRPQFLPNGRGVLFYVWAGYESESQVAVYDVDTGQRTTLLPGTSPRFASSRHLVFWREGSLWAVPFDPDRLRVQGDPLPIEQDVAASGLGFANYTLGKDGMLVYRRVGGETQGAQRTLAWVDREGNEEPVAAEPRPYINVRLSPEGQRVVTTVADPENVDIVIYDLARETPTRLTFDPATETIPVWTPDGEWVLFASFRTGPTNVFRKRADGSGVTERLTTSTNSQAPYSFEGERNLVGN